MNEEIPCITNERETTWNEWENDNSDFLQALCNVYKKKNAVLPIHRSVASYKYFKLISEV